MKHKNVLDKIIILILKVFVISALILPVLTTKAKNPELDGYYSRFILNNFFALLGIIIILFTALPYKRFMSRFLFGAFLLFAICLSYNILYLNNLEVIQFPWARWNTTISFALLITLLLVKTKEIFEQGNIIRYTIWAIIVTNVIGVAFYLKGYLSLHIYNFKLVLTKIDPNYYEKRFNWIYFYKCQYSCMLLLFIGLFVVHKKKFRNKLTYLLSLVILFCCLFVAHTNTSTVCAVFILAADFVDYLFANKRYLFTKITLLVMSSLGVAKLILSWIAQERDLSNLGSRIPIWKMAIEKIKENPQGLGNRFALNPKDWLQIAPTWKTNNCHNIFLNEMLRFSIPVGFCYLGFFLASCVYSLMKKFSFLRLSIWISFFIAVSMDYSVQTTELSMVMFMIYCIFFFPLEEVEE